MRFFSDARQGFKVEQDEKAWTVTLDLPGVAKDELSITIEGSHRSHRDQGRKPSASSRPPTSCRRTSTPTASTAKLENGVLTLTLAKKVPVSNARQIEIK